MKSYTLALTTFLLISCGGGGGGGSDSGGSSTPSNPAPSFTASDSALYPGESTTLTWSSSETSCTASGGWSGTGGGSGSQQVTIQNTGSNTFSIQCGNSSVVSVTITGIIDPTVTLDLSGDINALTEYVVNASIDDPQNRFSSSDWSNSSTTGDTFNYSSTDNSFTFTPPQQCEFQTVSVNLIITFDISNNNNGATKTTSANTELRIVPKIPSAPTNFQSSPGSQSASFDWTQSTGACSYTLYYKYDSPSITKEDSSIDAGTSNLTSLVKIINDKPFYAALSATNVSGESVLSNEVNITTTGPSNELTGQPNQRNFSFSEIDYWGNIIGDYSESLSNNAFCLRDNTTGNIWSIKKAIDTSAKHYTYGTYTYYDSTNVVNGVNDFGNQNNSGTSCSFADIQSESLKCNTQDYLQHINSGMDEGEAYCGLDGWKIPSQNDLLQVFTQIDDGNFDNVEEEVWTSTSIIENAPARQIVGNMIYQYPYNATSAESKSSLFNVRAISNVDETSNEDVNFVIDCIDFEVASDQNEDEHDPYYTLVEANDQASLYSNQTGITWEVPSLYELIHFKNKIPVSPGPTYKVTSSGGGTYSIQTAEYIILTSTPTKGTTNETTFSVTRNANNLLNVQDRTQGDGDAGSYKMCFKGPKGASIN